MNKQIEGGSRPQDIDRGRRLFTIALAGAPVLAGGGIVFAEQLLNPTAASAEAPVLPVAQMPEGWLAGTINAEIPAGQTLPELPAGVFGRVKMAMDGEWYGGADENGVEQGIDYSSAQQLLRYSGIGATEVWFLPQKEMVRVEPDFAFVKVPNYEFVLLPGQIPNLAGNHAIAPLLTPDTPVEMEYMGNKFETTVEAVVQFLTDAPENGATLRSRVDVSFDSQQALQDWLDMKTEWLIPEGGKPTPNYTALLDGTMNPDRRFTVSKNNIEWKNLSWQQVVQLGSDAKGMTIWAQPHMVAMPFVAVDSSTSANATE